MKVELPKGIKAIHGRMGNWVFRSYKQADGSYKVIAAWQPKRKWKVESGRWKVKSKK